MARARSGGGGSTIAAVLFGIGTFIFMILAIVFYLQVSTATQNAESANQELARVINRVDEESDFVKSARENGGSVVGALINKMDEMNSELIKERKKSNTLATSLDAANKRAEKAEQGADKANEAAAQAITEAKAIKDQYTKAGDALKAQIAKQSNDISQQHARIEKMGADLTSQMINTRNDLTAKNKELTTQNIAFKKENTRLSDIINANKKAGSVLEEITTKDGVIASMLKGNEKVYISLGAKNRIMLGMTFDVFGADEIIRLNELDELKGTKGKIEVIKVNENSAVARITHLEPNVSMSPGDQIVNAVYNPNATQKFYVYGNFNINGKGESTREDLKRIRNMITRWGGELVETDTLTADIDFLVVGQAPEAPQQINQNSMDSSVIKQFVELEKEYRTYHKLIADARSLSIPVLNQNRFLNLVGYYER